MAARKAPVKAFDVQLAEASEPELYEFQLKGAAKGKAKAPTFHAYKRSADGMAAMWALHSKDGGTDLAGFHRILNWLFPEETATALLQLVAEQRLTIPKIEKLMVDLVEEMTNLPTRSQSA